MGQPGTLHILASHKIKALYPIFISVPVQERLFKAEERMRHENKSLELLRAERAKEAEVERIRNMNAQNNLITVRPVEDENGTLIPD